MEFVDFDHAFEAYVTQWIQENSARLGDNMDRMEQEMPGLYLRWIETPAPFLQNQTPLAYFAAFDDPAQLVDQMRGYLKTKVPLPDLLLERLVEMGDAAEGPLLALLPEEGAPDEAALHTMNLLRQLESTAPMPRYIRWIQEADRADAEGLELAAEALLSMGEAAVPTLLAALPQATESGEALLLDILSHYPGHEAVVQRTLARFLAPSPERALFAGYLAKLGDPRCLDALAEVAALPDTNYLDFIEIAAAIEQLGGDPPAQRDFEGDPFYESLKQVSE